MTAKAITNIKYSIIKANRNTINSNIDPIIKFNIGTDIIVLNIGIMIKFNVNNDITIIKSNIGSIIIKNKNSKIIIIIII